MEKNSKFKLASIKETKDQGVISFILTKKVVDRDSEVIMPKGGDFTSFKKNPVLLWAHDMHFPPIGKILVDTLKTTDDEVEADVKFDMADPFAKLIHDKYKDGFLNAGSIRFIPTEIGREQVLPGQKGATITKWEMLEFSAVPVPANQEALAQKGFSDEELKDERAKKWHETLKEFAVDDNFDHTPEGWIEKISKIEEKELEINVIDEMIEQAKKIFVTADQLHSALQKALFFALDKKTVEHIEFDLDDSVEWDEKEALKNADDNYLCYGYCPADGEFKFLHHDIIDGKIVTVWKGVAAAMIDLLQGEYELTDEEKEKIYNHLAKHYKEFDKEPPEFEKEITLETEISEESPEEVEEEVEDELIDKAIEIILRERQEV